MGSQSGWDSEAFAGWSHWRFGNFDAYRVNPPLARLDGGGGGGDSVSKPRMGLVPPAVVPAIAASGNWAGIGQNEQRGCVLVFTLGRWACIPFSILGAVICYCWALDLYGSVSGLMAALLWCVSPTVLANAQMLTPDTAAAALGVTCCYAFWRWLREPDWSRALAAGILVGFAELTKTTWLILVPLWPAMWLVDRAWRRSTEMTQNGLSRVTPPFRREAVQLLVMGLVALHVLNTGYAFRNARSSIRADLFVSGTLGGLSPDRPHGPQLGNRFRLTWLRDVPVPLPADYVLGIDRQKLDFEGRMSSTCLRVEMADWRLVVLLRLRVVGEDTARIARAGCAHRGDFIRRARGHAADWREFVLLAGDRAVRV
ncbi:MAG: glycosyltransferase family 39 protein [Pirellulaceae bacterium]